MLVVMRQIRRGCTAGERRGESSLDLPLSSGLLDRLNRLNRLDRLNRLNRL